MQAWWVMPLRMFLGAYWLYEGIVKITQGWFVSPKLAEFMGRGFTRGYQMVDAASAATSAGQLRTDNIIDINANLVHLVVGNASKLVEGNVITSDIFAKIHLLHFGSFNFVPEIINGWVLSSQFWEMLFQVVIVLAEIVIGLMFLGGAFTFVASLVSLGLMGMFVTSTGLYLDSWWMPFASIATMGGAGRAFGMDYYLVPWYTRVWEYFWKNRKIKLIFKRKNSRE